MILISVIAHAIITFLYTALHISGIILKNTNILIFWLIISCSEIVMSIYPLLFYHFMIVEQYWLTLTLILKPLNLLAIWIMTKKYRDTIMADLHNSSITNVIQPSNVNLVAGSEIATNRAGEETRRVTYEHQAPSVNLHI